MRRIVLHYIDNAGFGGAEEILLALIEGLNRGSWEATLLHHDDPGGVALAGRARALGVPTRALQRPAGRRDRRQVARALAAEGASVFHAHLSWPLRCTDGLVAAARARIPAVVATQHLFSPISSVRAILRQRLVAARVDRYVAVSREVERGLAGTPLFPARKIEIIRNGIRLDAFASPPAPSLRPALTGGTGAPVVLTLARLDPQKGLSDLIRAARRIPGVVFAVAGDGPERTRLEAEALAGGVADRFRLLGHRVDVPALLEACDVFALPSLYEGLPVSVLEAMAAGRPVVATSIGGTDEAVRDGETGLLVPPRDAEALAAAIARLLSDPALARRLAGAGRELVEKEFSAERMVRETAGLYERLLAGRAPRAAGR